MIDWTAQDWRAVIQNLVASIVLIIAGDFILRTILTFVGGTRPRLKVSIGFHSTPLNDVDWPFLRVWNFGLALSLRTRAAMDVIAYGSVDDIDCDFSWSSSARTPPESTSIYGGRYADLPLAIRANANTTGNLVNYRNLMLARQAYLTERTFLTQGSGTVAGWPLTVGKHRVRITVQSSDGELTRGDFILDVPAWPSVLSIRPHE